MSEYCTFCETEIDDKFDEFPCCDDQKIRMLEKENARLRKYLKDACDIIDSETDRDIEVVKNYLEKGV